MSISATPPATPTTASDASERRRNDARWALVAGAVAAACGVAAVFFGQVARGQRGHGDPEGWLASIAFGAPFIAAGLLAVLGAFLDAPWHWWAAGMALAPMSVVSIVLFPVLFPAAALIALGFRNGPNGVRDLWGGVLAAALVAAFAVLLFHQDPVTWNGGHSSNIITTTEAVLSTATGVTVLVVGGAIAIPQRHRSST